MITRFAPSPTGPLHLGHAFAAHVARQMAEEAGGRFLLRIEDIDRSRARPEWEAQIFDDLHWLGLDWPQPVMRQSERLTAYQVALDRLWAEGLLYPCTCSRADIAAAVSAPQEGAPLIGPDGIMYPGTCRNVHPRMGPRPEGALRLDMALALERLSDPVCYEELGQPPVRVPHAAMRGGIGDVVLARAGMGSSYHLAVVVDDAAQGITHVTRGADLAEATPIHRVLQMLLDLPAPCYHHHRLIRDAGGKRLAKRDDARAIATYRAEGLSPADVWALVGVKTG